MTVYNYKKTVDITDDYYPVNAHLCVEYGTSLYFVPFQNTLIIRKLNTSTGASSVITTKTGTIIKFYFDLANDKLYFVHSLNTVAYIDLTDDSVSSDYTTTTDDPGTLGVIEDIVIHGSDLFVIDTSEDDLTIYKYDAVGDEWDNVGTVAEGATPVSSGSYTLNGGCWDGTHYFFIDYVNKKVYEYDISLTETNDYSLAGSGNDDSIGIAWNGTNFFITDLDGNVYKWDSAFSGIITSYALHASNTAPAGIVWDGTYFYITDYTRNTVFKYDSTFTYINEINTSSLGAPVTYGITWDGSFFYLLDDAGANAYVYKLSNDLTVLLDTYDVSGVGNTSPIGVVWDGNFIIIADINANFYKYYPDLIGDLGLILYPVVIGDNVYIIYQYIGEAMKIYVKDLTDSSNPSSLETLSSDYIIPYMGDQRGIAVSNDNNTLYFVLKDSTDGLTYLCSYNISGDTFTVSGEMNIALMLDRNSDSTNNPPFNIEKGFHLTSLYIYQIPVIFNGRLWKISDLTNDSDFSGHIIKAITDTYLITYDGSGSLLATFQDVSSNILDLQIYHSERDYPTATIQYNSNEYYIEEAMFVQVVGNVRINGSTAYDIRFEGYTLKPEDVDEEAVYIKEVDLINPSYFDLKNSFSGILTAGNFDDWLDIIVATLNYITKGTFDSGIVSISYYKKETEKENQQFFDQGTVIEGFTWRLQPKGIMDWTDGTDDSGINYDQDTPIWNVKVTKKQIRPNSISVKGAFIAGSQIQSASTEGQDYPDQQENGIIKIEVTIAWITTTALANSAANAILAVLNTEYTEVEFDVRDTTNGFIPPGEEITLEYTPKSITSAQYKINHVTFNDKTEIAHYIVSSIVRWDEEDLVEGYIQELSDQIVQVNDRTPVKTGWDAGLSYSDVTIAFDTLTFTLTPVVSELNYWIDGKKYSITSAKTVDITDTEGTWFIYFSAETLTASQTPWEIADGDKAFVSVFYYDATNNVVLNGLGWEFHSYQTSPSDHDRLHESTGLQYISGFALTEASEQITLTAGVLNDDGLKISVSDGVGSGLFEQDLSPLSAYIFYKSGASNAWRVHGPLTYPFYDNAGGDNVHYNLNSGGTWSSTAASTSAKYINYWVCGTTSISRPIFIIMGQAEYNTIAGARDVEISDLDLTGIPFSASELKFLYKVIVKSDSSYNSSMDYRKAQTPGGVYTPPVIQSEVPVGSVFVWINSTPPPNFLLCDGSAVSRSTYSDLFTVLGITHGQGDGSTTFNLPDYEGRFLRGTDNAAGRDPDAAGRTAMNTGGNTGDNVGSVQADAVDDHTHSYNSSGGGSPYFGALSAGASWWWKEIANTSGGVSGANTSTETRPLNAYVNFIIKY